jgi:phage protein D
MQPIFKVLADTFDISLRLKDRLVSIRTSDEAGFKADTCSIELDDRDGLIQLPRKGAKLEVFLGYRTSGLNQVGSYIVDEVSLSGPPDTMTISAKAADMREDFKSQKTRSFDNITLGDLVKTIAGENGLAGKVAGELAGVSFAHLDQTEESDLHLLTRLAKQHNGVAKVTHDLLIVAAAGQSKSVSGAVLPSVGINKSQVDSWHYVDADRGKYAAVTATWHNKTSGEKVIVSTSSAKPAYTLRHTYDNEQQAVEAAKAKLEELNQGAATMELSLAVGNSTLFAESALVLSGFRSGINGGNWTAKRVEHEFSNSGFTTRVSAETKI